jgi:hypothetical protein
MRFRRALTVFGVLVGFLLPAAGARAAVLPSPDPLATNPLSGAIEGRVTSTSGAGLADVCVDADMRPYTSTLFAGLTGDLQGSATTAADGTYSIRGLAAGDYFVLFHSCDGSAAYVNHYYGGTDSYGAQPVHVARMSTTSGIDTTMVASGGISGVVRDEHGNTVETCVQTTDEDGYAYSDTWSSDGAYALDGLAPGKYRVHFGCSEGPPTFVVFQPCCVSEATPEASDSGDPADTGFVSEWYDNVRLESDAALVTVDEGATTGGIDAVLAPGGAISGTVTDASGAPIASACVYAWSPSGNGDAEVGYDGSYVVRGLPAGSYAVQFYDCADDVWQSEYFDDQHVASRATLVHVSVGAVTGGVDATLAKRPRPDIAVTKVTSAGVPLQTDDVTVAHSPVVRDVTVDVANVGSADFVPGWWQDRISLTVWARTPSDGKTQRIGSADLVLRAGQTTQRVFRWNALGTVGDATIYAQACAWDDADRSNDVNSTHGFVVAGGTGIGATLLPDTAQTCW